MIGGLMAGLPVEEGQEFRAEFETVRRHSVAEFPLPLLGADPTCSCCTFQEFADVQLTSYLSTLSKSLLSLNNVCHRRPPANLLPEQALTRTLFACCSSPTSSPTSTHPRKTTTRSWAAAAAATAASLRLRAEAMALAGARPAAGAWVALGPCAPRAGAERSLAACPPTCDDHDDFSACKARAKGAEERKRMYVDRFHRLARLSCAGLTSGRHRQEPRPRRCHGGPCHPLPLPRRPGGLESGASCRPHPRRPSRRRRWQRRPRRAAPGGAQNRPRVPERTGRRSREGQQRDPAETSRDGPLRGRPPSHVRREPGRAHSPRHLPHPHPRRYEGSRLAPLVGRVGDEPLRPLTCASSSLIAKRTLRPVGRQSQAMPKKTQA
jgi:hypothetical protein